MIHPVRRLFPMLCRWPDNRLWVRQGIFHSVVRAGDPKAEQRDPDYWPVLAGYGAGYVGMDSHKDTADDSE